jgi:hypothetical protein
MGNAEVPSPLGWCSSCLRDGSRAAAVTVSNGHGLCSSCLSAVGSGSTPPLTLKTRHD